ncbi:MAG: cell division protein FtsB [Halomonadaceae bacterium]|uniref:Cell division protein FtsB n=1 Tax=Halomonas colorata TaxID=2742615 RepID=A0ABR9FV31_9GAMM|nr:MULTISPECIES: cell division protein FtsB [Halomonas]MBE0462472.1 cell division protein FtsB [Halomonas colorata]
MHKWLVVALLAVLGLLQYTLWLGNGGLRDLQVVEQRVAMQEADNLPMRERNARLAAEVTDLKNGLDAIEERARSDMGMVRSDEQFFWVPGVAIATELIGINAGLVTQPRLNRE